MKDPSVYNIVIRSGELGPLQISYTPSPLEESLNLLVYNLKERLSSLIHLVIVLKLTRHLPGIWAPWDPCHQFLNALFFCVCGVLIWKQSAWIRTFIWEAFGIFCYMKLRSLSLLSVFYKAFQCNDLIQAERREWKKLLDPSQQNSGNKCPSLYVKLHSLTCEILGRNSKNVI